MKGYENIFRFYFTRRMPLIVRIDGKAFHSFTKGFKRPFDPLMMQAMQKTAAYLCAHIEGCALAYTQSDEISLLLIDYTGLDTQPWFGKNLQKIASVAASMATMAFNQAFYEGYYGLLMDIATDGKGDKEERVNAAEAVYERKLHTAMFDARAFVLPKEEVCNYFIWRQLDAARNSIEMVGRAHFSHSALHKKTCRDICEMLMNRVADPVVWESLPADQRH